MIPPDIKEMRFVGEIQDVKWATFKKALIYMKKDTSSWSQ